MVAELLPPITSVVQRINNANDRGTTRDLGRGHLTEDATVRLSDFNALKEMFHELKDMFESLKMEKTMEAMTQKSGDASDQMTSLQCFNSKDVIKPDQYDMEPGTFHNWNELFVSYMMSN